MVGWVDAQKLFEDAKEGIAGDVEGEETSGADAAMVAEPREGGSEREVPDDLVEEGRVEGGVGAVAVGSVGGVDLKRPGQRGWLAEQFLVEVVADAADRLRDEQRGCCGVEESWDVRPAATQDPEPGEGAGKDAAPDAQAAVPNRERSPPGMPPLIPARDKEVQAPADNPGGDAPERDLVDEFVVSVFRAASVDG